MWLKRPGPQLLQLTPCLTSLGEASQVECPTSVYSARAVDAIPRKREQQAYRRALVLELMGALVRPGDREGEQAGVDTAPVRM
jgi:hypothetical protein